MIKIVSDTVLDDIISKRGYTPTIVRDLAARYRELVTYTEGLEAAVANFQRGCEAPSILQLLTEQQRRAYAASAIEDYGRRLVQYRAAMDVLKADEAAESDQVAATQRRP